MGPGRGTGNAPDRRATSTAQPAPAPRGRFLRPCRPRPVRRLPRRSHDGDQLRRTARMIALAGDLTGEATLTAIALVAQLVALAAAVAELRQAQQLAAQAQAARTAAAHLHTAVNQSRPWAARFGHARSRGPTPAASAAKLAGQDTPAGTRQPQPTAGSAEPARSRSPQQPRPRRRAGPARNEDCSRWLASVQHGPDDLADGSWWPVGGQGEDDLPNSSQTP